MVEGTAGSTPVIQKACTGDDPEPLLFTSHLRKHFFKIDLCICAPSLPCALKCSFSKNFPHYELLPFAPRRGRQCGPSPPATPARFLLSGVQWLQQDQCALELRQRKRAKEDKRARWSITTKSLYKFSVTENISGTFMLHCFINQMNYKRPAMHARALTRTRHFFSLT